jgi:NADH-quinone oxidoreductase subunit M
VNAFLAAINYAHWGVSALLVIPLAGALAIWAAPGQAAKKVAFAVALVEFVVSAGLWWAYDPAGPAMQVGGWLPWIPAWGIEYRIGVDGISLFMVLLTTFLMPLAVLGSWSGITKREKAYYALLLVLTTGMIGVFVSLDLFLFYVFWEVMLIPM